MIENQIDIKVITTQNDFTPIEDEWNEFINTNKFPVFYQSSFLKNSIIQSNTTNCTPYLILIYLNNKIVGGIPLRIRNVKLYQQLEYMYNDAFLPDFFIEESKENIIKDKLNAHLFKLIRNRVLKISITNESQSIKYIKKYFTSKNRSSHIELTMGHKILYKKSTWEEYKKSRSNNYRKKIRRIVNSYSKPYNIIEEKDIKRISKIISHVDNRSWKQEWAYKRGIKTDQQGNFVINSINDPENLSEYKLYYIEYENNIISYVLIFIDNKVVYICKTSYDKKYNSQYPGLLVMNEMLKRLHLNDEIMLFNFQTNLGFMSLWTKTVMNRYRITIYPKKIGQIMMTIKDLFALCYCELIKRPRMYKTVFDILIPILIRAKSRFSTLISNTQDN